MERERRNHPWLTCLAAAMIVTVLYVASSGPAYWIFWKVEGEPRAEQGLSKTWYTIYGPLLTFCNWCPAANDAMDWYIGCFVD